MIKMQNLLVNAKYLINKTIYIIVALHTIGMMTTTNLICMSQDIFIISHTDITRHNLISRTAL